MDAAKQIKDAQAEEYEQIFQKYLEICNRALEQNKTTFPYAEILGARFKAMEAEATLHATIYDDRPKIEFVLHFTRDMKIEIMEKMPVASEGDWPFNYLYLKNVVDNPQEYIENPAKLEWGWLEIISEST